MGVAPGEESAALAGLTHAAVLGRTALGGRTGRGPLRISADLDAPWVERAVPLHSGAVAPARFGVATTSLLRGTTAVRHGAFGAKIPWYRSKFTPSLRGEKSNGLTSAF
jgi:hypothetical protein